MTLLESRVAKVRGELLRPTASALESALEQLSVLQNRLDSGEWSPSPPDALAISRELRSLALLSLQARELYGEILAVESGDDDATANYTQTGRRKPALANAQTALTEVLRG
jgi:hypothetical protein